MPPAPPVLASPVPAPPVHTPTRPRHVDDESKLEQNPFSAPGSRRHVSHQPYHSPNEWFRRRSPRQRRVVAVDEHTDFRQHPRGHDHTPTRNEPYMHISRSKDWQQTPTPSRGVQVRGQSDLPDRARRPHYAGVYDESKHAGAIGDGHLRSPDRKYTASTSPNHMSRHGSHRDPHLGRAGSSQAQPQTTSPGNRTPTQTKLGRNHGRHGDAMLTVANTFAPWKLLHTWGASVQILWLLCLHANPQFD